MVIVEPRLRQHFTKQQGLFRRHSSSGGRNVKLLSTVEQPAVDFPVQFNFGSLYSSSLTIFLDFDSELVTASGSRSSLVPAKSLKARTSEKK